MTIMNSVVYIVVVFNLDILHIDPTYLFSNLFVYTMYSLVSG